MYLAGQTDEKYINSYNNQKMPENEIRRTTLDINHRIILKTQRPLGTIIHGKEKHM